VVLLRAALRASLPDGWVPQWMWDAMRGPNLLHLSITHCSCLPARIICSRAAGRGRVGKSRIIRRADLASAGIGGGADASWVVKNIDVTNRAGLRAGIGESGSGGCAAGKRFAGTSHAPAHQTRSNLKEN
jgi:hypothetical protein